MSDLVDDIKVEVQLPPEEGDNLITNTSGQYGAWQWSTATDVAGVSIIGDPTLLTIQVLRNNTAGLTAVWTDYVPVTPGKYANARVDLVSITSGHKVTLGLQFYNSSQVVISAQYSSPSSTIDTLAFSSVTVPANAAYARMLVILDKTADPIPTTGSANANAQTKFWRAMLTEVSTSGVPSNTIRNMVANGGFQYVTTGWAAGTNIATVTRTTSGGGAYTLRGTFIDGVSLSAGEYSYINGPYIPGIEAGENYSLRIDVYNPGGTAEGDHWFEVGVLYRWFTDANVQIGASVYLTNTSPASGWRQFWQILTAPAGATKLRLYPFAKHRGPTAPFSDAWFFSVDSVVLVKSSVLQPYFDGDTPDTSSNVYAWDGTPGNSTSTRTSVGAVDYVEPDEQFIDITGGYNRFELERDELDISTMNGIVVDPALSPARADSMILPGRLVRVSAMRPGVGWWKKFTGTLGPSSVEYEPLEDEKRQKVKITVTATGRESALAQASRPAVALTAAALPALALAQAGVPWDVDGSTGITPATSVATNDNATALDQIALTRDTVGGTAWVDPSGVIRFRTALGAKSTGPNTMGPTDYSADGLKVSFSTDNLINSVQVIRLIRASDGSTEERQAGQTYENAASVRKWGRHSATLTIASTPGATTDAQTAANRILAGNAVPSLAIEEVAVNSADDRDHAFHDLYDLITVTAETIDGTITKPLRVARIRDEFTTEKRPGGQGRWRTTYGFKVAGVVASPAVQPPVSSIAAGGWTVFTKVSPSTSMASIVLEYRITNGMIEWRTSGNTAEAISVPASGDIVNQNVTTSIPSDLRPALGNWAWVLSIASNSAYLAITPGGTLTLFAVEGTGTALTIPSGSAVLGQSPAFVLP